MVATGGTVPTLSQVRTWDTQHLTEAAAFWTKTATVWEDAFTELASRISAPGGVPWDGEAAEAAQQLASSDKMTVIGLADQLHSASAIARAGATEISEAHRLVMRIVQTAEGAGFTVGEDFSVTDPNYYDAVTAAARQAQAEVFATDLRATVGTLLAADAKVAGSLLSATAGLGANVFPEGGDAEGKIQAVGFGNRFKQEGPTPAPPPQPEQPSASDIILRNAATGPDVGGSKGGAPGLPGSLLPDNADWILGGAGATAQTFADKVAQMTRSSLATGGAGASPTLTKVVGEIKNPFTFMGKAAPSLGSKMGGGVGVIMSIPQVAKDVGEGKMSAAQAIARSGVGFVGGTVVAAPISAIPIAGPPTAAVVAIAVGNVAAKGVDLAWEPLQEFGKAAADGGFKAARLGR